MQNKKASTQKPSGGFRPFLKSTLLQGTVVTTMFTFGFETLAGEVGSSANAPQAASYLTSRITPSLGCSSFRDDLFDALYAYLQPSGDSEGSFPSPAAMNDAFDKMLLTSRFVTLVPADHSEVLDRLNAIYKAITVDAVTAEENDDDTPATTKLEVIGSVDTSDRTTDTREKVSAKVDGLINELAKFFVDRYGHDRLTALCKPSQPLASPMPQNEIFSSWANSRTPAVYGALKTFATAYQSCSAAGIPALTSATPDVLGIHVYGTYSDGVGCKRKIGKVDDLVASEPYLTNYQRPSASCFDVLHHPLIYSYGGRPIADDDAGTFDLFKRYAGAGSQSLGIDCSAYVFTSLATAGLKVRSDGALRASLVYGTTARQFKNPKKGGYTCFDYANFTPDSSLKPGDVLAENGHVVMIEKVGADPFGINHITNAADCKIANIDTKTFDFTLLQSSASKNGIGINRMRGADFLEGGGDMSDGMKAHAVSACLARTQNKTVQTSSPAASLVRHLGTPECLGQPIQLLHQDCLDTCKAAAENPQPDFVTALLAGYNDTYADSDYEDDVENASLDPMKKPVAHGHAHGHGHTGHHPKPKPKPSHCIKN